MTTLARLVCLCLVLSACGGDDQGGGGDGGSGEKVCFDEACTVYCEDDVLTNATGSTRCPTELGSTCEVDPGQRIKCTCGSIPPTGSCYEEDSRAVWATCYAPRSELTFYVCAAGRTCDESPACFCNPDIDSMCVAPAICTADPDCV